MVIPGGPDQGREEEGEEGGDVMKVVIPSMDETLNSPMDTRFGHAKKLILFDTNPGQHQVVDNTQNIKEAKGSGIRVVENLSRLGAEYVITEHCGSIAFSMLQAAGIKVIYSVEGSTVAEAIEMFLAGKLQPAQNANLDGYWI
jgi:predicted Fe-Mo cluster-binding NifX family protein